ncbi:MAG: peroxiredoxin, partial [Solirubrobacteraceae bacterium]|nr:peroxiredoxin [Solirubrobacteraceae bacterium]
MPAKGHAEWNGDLKSGNGTFTAGEGISGEFSFKSRFEDG